MLDLKTLAATIKPGEKAVRFERRHKPLLISSDALPSQAQPRHVIVAFLQIAQEV